MIKFFRKIRYKLLSRTRIRKYLVYAVGEIVLVVIGILIALQINNWNEQRKSQILSHEMVLELKSGIKSDLKELNRLLDSQKGILKSQVIISNWLKSDTSFDDSLSFHFLKTYMTSDYTVNYADYETLKKFGLRRIPNDSLRISIANLYEVKYPTFIKYTEIYQNFLDKLLGSTPEHFNELNYTKTTMRPLDIFSLKEDGVYTYNLNSLKNFNQLLIFQGQRLMSDIQKANSKF